NVGTLSGFNDPPIATSGWNAGPHGGALAFDGTNDYVTIPDSDLWNFGSSPFSIFVDVIWKNTDGAQFLIGQRKKDVNAWGFYITANTLKVNVISVWPTVSLAFTTPFVPVVGTLYRLALVRIDDGNAATSWAIFINNVSGVLTKTAGAWNAPLPDVAETLVIGRNGDDNSSYINGLISFASIYNRALSAEVAYSYAFPFCMFEETWQRHFPWTLSTIAAARYKILTDKNALVGTKVYYVADASEGGVTRKLTFIDGILAAEI
ncbi:MAG: LamG domain-containing protein, partial [Gammaproteobacteria bacterium]|nr:LamG domain-containing protein [Gammaproteobacteria bacterium]